MIDKRPAAIARCANVADVSAAVNFARTHRLDVAVRGGGHNIAGSALCDGGLVIDLSSMKRVHVDPLAQRAYVQAGATLADVDRETQKFGLAVPTGINSTTGIAGLTLGGGFGWLSRRLGLTIDSLLSTEVVKADGQTVHANAAENADLFWALRGGGGNFGIVTKFEFRLHRVGPEVFAGLIVFPLTDAKSVLQKYRAFMATAPLELNVWAILRKAPPLPFLSSEIHGREVLVLAIFHTGGRLEESLALVEPLRGLGKRCGEHLGLQPFTAWQQAFDPLLAPGARNYWKSHNFAKLDEGLFDAAIESARQLPSPDCEIFIGALGGAVTKPAVDSTAYGARDANFAMNVHSRWETPEEDRACIAWARAFHKAAEPFATGSVYVNFLTGDESERVAAAYGPNYKRLAELKAKYDPDNLFHINQNIKPAGKP
ncbi:MAG: FAD-binding oxidoreductase [Nibricoccus sp.]